MGLRDEWDAIQRAVARVAADVTHLSTTTVIEGVGTITTVTALDGDTVTRVHGALDGAELHRAALAFTRDLARARMRMLADVIGTLL